MNELLIVFIMIIASLAIGPALSRTVIGVVSKMIETLLAAYCDESQLVG